MVAFIVVFSSFFLTSLQHTQKPHLNKITVVIYYLHVYRLVLLRCQHLLTLNVPKAKCDCSAMSGDHEALIAKVVS